MALRFNVPPNWPKPPEGWTPQPGWQPDPAWGPAPEGWRFWVEESALTDSSASAAAAPSEQAGDGNNSATESEQASTSSAESTAAPAAESSAGLESGDGAAPAETAGETGVDPATEVFDTGQTSDSSTTPAASTGTADSPDGPQQTRQFPQQPITAEAGQAQQPSQPQQQWNGQANYQQPGTGSYQGNPYQQGQPNPYNQSPAQKKNFFSTTAGILTIVGAILLALIIALVLVFSIFSGNNSSTESSSTSSSSSAASSPSASSRSSASSNSDSGSAADSGESKSGESGAYTEYTGTGNDVLKVAKPEGSSKAVWVEYEYKASGNYGNFDLSGQDEDGETTTLGVYLGYRQPEAKGSMWLDTDSEQKDTAKLTVTASGEWTIRIHPASAAPSYGAGDTISGNSSTAFIYKGGASNVKVKYTGEDGNDTYRLQKYDSDIEYFTSLLNGNGPESESSASLSGVGSNTAMNMINYGGNWEITFE